MKPIDGDSLIRSTQSISNRDDFVSFVELLSENSRRRKREWNNTKMESYLSGLAGFARDMDGYYQRIGVPMDVERPTWRMIADMLLAARVYE